MVFSVHTQVPVPATTLFHPCHLERGGVGRTCQSAGIGACAGDGLALRHVEIHRAPDGQSAPVTP